MSADLSLSLGCKDALYLDGVVSWMRFGDDLKIPTGGFGSLIAVVEHAGE